MSVEKDWHLKAWAALKGKRQAHLVNELGWPKNTAHLVWHSKQPYGRARVNQLAEWLEIEPYELLMDPREAVALRALREAARSIVEGDDISEKAEPKTATTARRRA